MKKYISLGLLSFCLYSSSNCISFYSKEFISGMGNDLGVNGFLVMESFERKGANYIISYGRDQLRAKKTKQEEISIGGITLVRENDVYRIVAAGLIALVNNNLPGNTAQSGFLSVPEAVAAAYVNARVEDAIQYGEQKAGIDKYFEDKPMFNRIYSVTMSLGLTYLINSLTKNISRSIH